MFELLPSIPTILLIIGSVVVGFIALYGIFDRQWKDRNKERDGLEEKIRALYKEESQAQESKITTLEHKIEELEKHVQKISNENKVMKDLIQGRDKSTQEFQKQGFDTMKRYAQTEEMIAEQGRMMVTINANVERLATAIEKHLSLPEKTIIQTKEVKTRGGE